MHLPIFVIGICRGCKSNLMEWSGFDMNEGDLWLMNLNFNETKPLQQRHQVGYQRLAQCYSAMWGLNVASNGYEIQKSPFQLKQQE